GIDSIKRVEILSMVKKVVPELPELDAATLGALETLNDVALHLQQALASTAPRASVKPSQPAALPPTESAENLVSADHRYIPGWVSAPLTRMSRLLPDSLQSIAVVGGQAGLKDAVVTQLQRAGYAAYATETPAPSDDGLVLLHGMETIDHPQTATDRLRHAFQCLRSATQVLSDKPSLIASVGHVGDDRRRWPLAGLAALIKTAHLEAPTTTAFALEVDSSENETMVATYLVEELTAGGLENHIRRRANRTREALMANPQILSHKDLDTNPLQPQDVVVVSGGARGVTAHCLVQLAKVQPLRLVLLGRTPLADESEATATARTEGELKRALIEHARRNNHTVSPADIGKQSNHILATREIKGTLSALHEAGSAAVYIPVDVADHGALATQLANIRGQWGPVAGVIHAAGIIQDKRIQDKSDEQWDRVITTKLGGLLALLNATAGDPIKMYILFSSVAAFGGNVGQADYAAANAALDAFAEQCQQHHPNVLVKSLAWGPWRGGMVSTALEAHFEAAGVPLIELTKGAQWMVEELSAPTHPRVILGGQPSLGNLALDTSTHLHIELGQQNYPELEDHAVAGPPVVPVVLVSEWMLSALSGRLPNSPILVLEDLRVRRGIQLDRWPQATRLMVSVTPVAADRYTLSLTDADGQVRYSATGAAMPEMPQPPSPAASLPEAPNPKPYGGVLFHGPKFQAFNQLQQLGPQGAISLLHDSGALGWNHLPSRVDPVRMDGALQMAVLVTEQLIGGASLPTRIRRLVVDIRARQAGAGRAWSVTGEHSTDQVSHTLVIEDGAGHTAVLLDGVETTRRPNWTPST
nr:SDR family NAD(P)-dependent oxidoreductase [Myxococcales bacterium]